MDKYYVLSFFPFEGYMIEEYETIEEALENYRIDVENEFIDNSLIIKGEIIYGEL